MNVDQFDYDLPEELIAQYPAPERTGSRMLVMGRRTGRCELHPFAEFPRFLRSGDCLVLNDTRVIAARLFGRRNPTGGRVEAFLLERLAAGRWQCLLKPGRRLHPGDRVCVDGDSGVAFTVTGRRSDGTFEICFDVDDVSAVLDQVGRVPLPPYIRREAEPADRHRYQTVYARREGAVAAPTAGLHFTPALLADVAAAGVQVVHLTLHVGAGTFKPVVAERVEEHDMHEEVYELPASTAAAVNRTRAQGGRVVAVGTTAVRALETCAVGATGQVAAGQGRTRIFLHPPKTPRVVDALLTNFHLPRSTLLMLVATFSPLPHVLAAYRLAVRERLRFYSYGDCMLLLPD